MSFPPLKNGGVRMSFPPFEKGGAGGGFIEDLAVNLVAWLDYLNQLPLLPQPEAIRILPRVIREGWRQWSCPVITITGTNGKGSTATLVSAILRAQGMRVACYTSPHLFDFRERLRILGKICSESAWRQAFEWVQAGQQPDEYYSFFDWVTLAALYQ